MGDPEITIELHVYTHTGHRILLFFFFLHKMTIFEVPSNPGKLKSDHLPFSHEHLSCSAPAAPASQRQDGMDAGRGDLGHLSGTVPVPHPHTCPHALTQCHLSMVHSMQGQDRGSSRGEV